MTISAQRRYDIAEQHMSHGERLDVIHALGGVLNTAVVNVHSAPHPRPTKSFPEWAEAYDGWLKVERHLAGDRAGGRGASAK